MSLNEINDLLQECAMVSQMTDDLEKELNDKHILTETELYNVEEKVIKVLTAVNAYLRRFNEFMDSQYEQKYRVICEVVIICYRQPKPNEQKSM